MNVHYSTNTPRYTAERLDDEVILLDLEAGNYYSLEGESADLWSLVTQNDLDSAIVALEMRYEAAPGVVREAALELIRQLEAEGAVRVASGLSPAHTQSTITDAVGSRQTFGKFKLEKYTDMQDLLLLDPIHDVDETGWPRAHENPRG